MPRCLLAVVCVLLAASGSAPRAQRTDPPFAGAGPLSSPRIAALEKAVGSGNGGRAAAAFWKDVERTAPH